MIAIKNNVFSCVEEPGDLTRYSHVFELTWNKTHFTVHTHSCDNGCSLNNTDRFYSTAQIGDIGDTIMDMTRGEMTTYLLELPLVKGFFGTDENINTIGSVCRCIARLIPKDERK